MSKARIINNENARISTTKMHGYQQRKWYVQAQKAGELQQSLLNTSRQPILYKTQSAEFAALLGDQAAASSFERCFKLHVAEYPELSAQPAEAAAQLQGMFDCLGGKVGLTL